MNGSQASKFRRLTRSKRLKRIVVKIAFIGTVRAHKGILEAARAIQLLRYTSQLEFEFHVYGDVRPESLVRELEAAGAVVLQNIPMAELTRHLQQMDVILSGFPTVGDEEITKYQISSKIGDALSVGKPVLVRLAPSTADLKDTPGVILFDRRTFASALMRAARCDEHIRLPYEFTLEGANDAFEAVLEQADGSARSGEALRVLPEPNTAAAQTEAFLVENLLLPTNTTVVLFPIVNMLEKALWVISPYRKVVDVVDNQFSWGSSDINVDKRFQYAALPGERSHPLQLIRKPRILQRKRLASRGQGRGDHQELVSAARVRKHR